MNQSNIEEKYPELKEAFPDLFLYLINNDGELNGFGKIAKELVELRKKR